MHEVRLGHTADFLRSGVKDTQRLFIGYLQVINNEFYSMCSVTLVQGGQHLRIIKKWLGLGYGIT